MALADEVREILEGSLTTMWKNATSNREIASPPLPNRSIFRKGGGFAVLTKEGLKAYDDFVNAVLTVPGVAAKLSRKRIQELTGDSVLDVMNISPLGIVSSVKASIQTLVKKLQEPVVDWKVIFPISNLVMDLPELALGRVRFLSGEMILDAKKEILDVSARIDPERKIDPDGKARLLIDQSLAFAGSAIAEVSVTATEPGQAERLADSELQNALGVLRFVNALDYRRRRMFVDVLGRTWSTRLDLAIYSKSAKAIALPESIAGYFEPMQLSPEIPKMPSYQRLNLLLRKTVEQRSELEKRLVGSLRTFSSALSQLDDRSAFVGIMFSLEGFLLRGHGPAKELLAERLAFLIGKDAVSRKAVYDRSKALYDLRSNIAHGKDVEVEPSELQELTTFAYMCFGLALGLTQRFSDLAGLLNQIEGMKFSF